MSTGFTCSAFDLLHAGHVEMLRECKEHCDWLIVGLHVNPRVDRPAKNAPVQSVYERYVQLRACKYVDEIIPYETEEDLINIMAIEPINIRFVGIEYKDTYFIIGVDMEKITDAAWSGVNTQAGDLVSVKTLWDSSIPSSIFMLL